MTRTTVFIVTILLAMTPAPTHGQEAISENSTTEHDPWEKYSLSLGGYITEMNTELRYGGKGLGFDIDAEEILNLDSNTFTYRIDAHWRFSENRRHRWDLRIISLHRNGSRSILRDIEIEGPNGNIIEIPAGTSVESYFDLDIYQTSYSYSFFQDDRIDLGVITGLYIMPINLGLNATGLVEANEKEKFIAPLPSIGLRADFAITPNVFLRSRSQLFYIRVDSFKGFLTEQHFAVEYLPAKHFGMGIGYDVFRMRIESDGEDYPNIDLKGNISFEYGAFMLYGKVYL